MGKGADGCDGQVGMAFLGEVIERTPEIGDKAYPPNLDAIGRKCITLSQKGLLREDIAKRLGISLYMVDKYRKESRAYSESEFCIAMKSLPDGRPEWLDDAIGKYWLEWKSLGDISRELGVSKETIREAFINANIQRRKPSPIAPRRFIEDPNSPSNKALLKEARSRERQLKKQGRNVDARRAAKDAAFHQSRREVHIHVEEGPFSDRSSVEIGASELFELQQVLGEPVGGTNFEAVTVSIYDEYYDSAEKMPPGHPGRDVNVKDGDREFGVSNKSEVHKDISESNRFFTIAHYLNCKGGAGFAAKAKGHNEDSDYILLSRSFRTTFPGTDEPAQCYKIFKIPSVHLRALEEVKDLPKNTSYISLSTPPYPQGTHIKTRRYKDGVGIEIPAVLAELQASIFLPPPPE